MSHDPFAAPRPSPSLPPPEPLEGRRPRLLAHVLRYFDWHSGGAERMLHGVLKGMQQRGWDVTAVTVEHRNRFQYEWDGIPVNVLTDAQLAEPYAWCDIALTHLDVTPGAMAWARYGRPLLHLVHNHRQLAHHRVADDGTNFPVWNSQWIAAEWAGAWRGPSVVCRPPVHGADHKTTNAKRATARTATLVHLLGEKGGPLFWRVARRCPDWTFLGVRGAYGMAVIPDPMPDNGVVADNTPDMEPIWKQTSVLLVPSWYESWSMSAVEALASGIPVIAHPTPGLRESMTSPKHGECAWFIDRDDDDAWVDALAVLKKATEWRKWSKLSRLRSSELDQQSDTDLDSLDVFARSLI